jgi:hypothetical protein
MSSANSIPRTCSSPTAVLGPSGKGGKIIGLAGVMGGADVEVNDQTTDVVIEAAHFDPISIARTSRRHKLSSEASRRFERGVDPKLGPVAARRCADLLVELGGGTLSPATTQVGQAPEPTVLDLKVARVASLGRCRLHSRRGDLAARGHRRNSVDYGHEETGCR